MPFNSTDFLVYFIFVYIIYRILPHKAQNLFLLIASYIFFGWWDVRFLYLIIFSTSLDFFSGLLMVDGQIPSRQRLGISLWTVLSGLALLVVRWDRLRGSENTFSLTEDFYRWFVLATIILLVLLFNILYPKLALQDDRRRRKLFLLVSVIGNLSILGIFKYLNFFLENLETLFRYIGLNTAHLHLNIVLPVGISFYTFMTLSYVIDVYKGRLAPARVYHEYALFVAFFPKLLAGPIERAKNFLPQISAERKITVNQIIQGMQEIIYGFFKKIVIADGLAQSVNSVFAGTYRISWVDALIGTLCFTIQVYCDFSGYSDIATGISRVLGFNLMRNFRFPYFARNPTEFWGRWNISLSSWFRDYVFFPLGGPYGRTVRWIKNVLLTFLITGLWHGAGWNFVLWGLYHGILLCIHRLKEALRKSRKATKNIAVRSASVVTFFSLTCLGWIFFRANSLRQITDFIKALLNDFDNLKVHAALPAQTSFVGFPLFIIAEYMGNKLQGKYFHEVLPIPLWTAAFAAMVFLILLALANVPASFIYFVF